VFFKKYHTSIEGKEIFLFLLHMKELFRKVFNFYYEGFRSMTVGKKLWIIILIKLFFIFFIFRLFFFHDFLDKKFRTPGEKSSYVIEELTTKSK
jgi:hypothetical protein